MSDVLNRAKLAAEHPATVLIEGETGAGKGVVARYIHDHSPRADGPFVVLNCAGLSRELAESELLGHERGAFTGATTLKRGLLEVAAGGTVFLDEISEMDLVVQAKLLLALERRRFRRIGGLSELTVDVRFVAATHRSLRESVRAGTFREDLFYRLAVFSLRVPPLRERPDDIAALADHFARQLGTELGLDARRWLMSQPWPGNVRQLRNAIERACILCPRGAPVGVEHLDLDQGPTSAEVTTAPPRSGARMSMSEMERSVVARTLARHNYNIKATARTLGVSRGTIYRKIRKYDLALGRHSDLD